MIAIAVMGCNLLRTKLARLEHIFARCCWRVTDTAPCPVSSYWFNIDLSMCKPIFQLSRWVNIDANGNRLWKQLRIKTFFPKSKKVWKQSSLNGVNSAPFNSINVVWNRNLRKCILLRKWVTLVRKTRITRFKVIVLFTHQFLFLFFKEILKNNVVILLLYKSIAVANC